MASYSAYNRGRKHYLLQLRHQQRTLNSRAAHHADGSCAPVPWSFLPPSTSIAVVATRTRTHSILRAGMASIPMPASSFRTVNLLSGAHPLTPQSALCRTMQSGQVVTPYSQNATGS